MAIQNSLKVAQRFNFQFMGRFLTSWKTICGQAFLSSFSFILNAIWLSRKTKNLYTRRGEKKKVTRERELRSDSVEGEMT